MTASPSDFPAKLMPFTSAVPDSFLTNWILGHIPCNRQRHHIRFMLVAPIPGGLAAFAVGLGLYLFNQ